MTARRPWVPVLAGAVLVAAAAGAWAGKRADSLWEKAPAARDAEDGSGRTAPDGSADPDAGPKTDDPGDENGLGAKEPYDTGGLLGHSLAAVLIILVLGAAAVFVVKRVLPRLGISQGRRITVLETVYLGPRKSLHMVRVGERTLLVSGTRERLGLLADVTDSVPPEPPAPESADRPRPRRRFPIFRGEPEDA